MLCLLREKLEIFFQVLVKILGIPFQRNIGIPIPMYRQKMIVEDIDDHSGVVALCCMQKFAACSCRRVTVGIAVNCPMKHDALLYPLRKVTDPIPFNVISKEVTEDNFLLVKRQVNVSEKIHWMKLQRPFLIRYPSPYICKNFYQFHDTDQIHLRNSRNYRRTSSR